MVKTRCVKHCHRIAQSHSHAQMTYFWSLRNPGLGATLDISMYMYLWLLQCQATRSATHLDTMWNWGPFNRCCNQTFPPIYHTNQTYRTCVLTDSKPCMQAFEKLCRGEFSSSPRVSTFISTYQVSIRHVWILDTRIRLRYSKRSLSSMYITSSKNLKTPLSDTYRCPSISTFQWSFDPHFSCNLTSNQSKCLKQIKLIIFKTSRHWTIRNRDEVAPVVSN
jgi:hypothetical protein